MAQTSGPDFFTYVAPRNATLKQAMAAMLAMLYALRARGGRLRIPHRAYVRELIRMYSEEVIIGHYLSEAELEDLKLSSYEARVLARF